MADPVTAGIGVVSTISKVTGDARQRSMQRAQLQVKAQEAQVKAEMARQQSDIKAKYNEQVNQLAEQQYRAQDIQARLELQQQDVQSQMQEAQALFQSKQELGNADIRLAEQLQGLASERYSVSEAARQRDAQGLQASTQTNQQLTQGMAEITKALNEGDSRKASRLAQQYNQQGSASSNALLSKESEDLIEAMKQKAAAGRITEDDLQQLRYNKEISGLLKDIGFTSVNSQEQAALRSNANAKAADALNEQLIGSQSRRGDIGRDMAYGALDAAGNIRTQQNSIRDAFAGLERQSSLNAINAQQASDLSQVNYQQEGTRGNGLLSALAVGSSLVSAATPYLYKGSGVPTATNRPSLIQSSPRASFTYE